MAWNINDGVNTYRTDDGRTFTTEKEAQEHANSLGSSSSSSGGTFVPSTSQKLGKIEEEQFLSLFYADNFSAVIAKAESNERFRHGFYAGVVGTSYLRLGNYDQAIKFLEYHCKNNRGYSRDGLIKGGPCGLRDKELAEAYNKKGYYDKAREIENEIRRNEKGSSSTGGGSILFNIIGAIVVAIIGFNILGWLGLIGGAVGGFFLGKWLSGKLIGKILLIALLVIVGGTFIISKLPSKPAADNTQTATEEAGK